MQDILDLDRFPLDNPETPEWRALVTRCRGDLDRDGMFNLNGLMRPAAIETAVREVSPVFETNGFSHRRRHNIYFKKEIPDLAPDHPRGGGNNAPGRAFGRSERRRKDCSVRALHRENEDLGGCGRQHVPAY